MFHFDITCEDQRLVASETPHDKFTPAVTMEVALIDNLTGNRHMLHAVTFCDLEKLISGMICCHGDVAAKDYPGLEQLLEGCPQECRPIP